MEVIEGKERDKRKCKQEHTFVRTAFNSITNGTFSIFDTGKKVANTVFLNSRSSKCTDTLSQFSPNVVLLSDCMVPI